MGIVKRGRGRPRKITVTKDINLLTKTKGETMKKKTKNYDNRAYYKGIGNIEGTQSLSFITKLKIFIKNLLTRKKR